MAATTNGDAGGRRAKFPEIVLDVTLAELLAEEPSWRANESLCNIKPCADAYHKTIPHNRKYLITSTPVSDMNDLAHLQLENVSYLLSFWAGNMEVPLLASEGWTDDETLTQAGVDANGRRAFSVLNEKQRPKPRTFRNTEHFIKEYGSSETRVRWGFAVDFAEQIPSFVHPEVQYKLNSKRWLAECPLLSANDRIIDPECSCSTHKTKDGLWYFGSDCNECNSAVDNELERLKTKLQNTEPPFVLKLTQSLGSVGTMIAKNKDDKNKIIEDITEVQAESLRKLVAEGAHVHPASLILSDMLPGDTHAINFYVKGDGSIKFLGACQQLSTRGTEGGRQHTALTWDHQEKSELRFKDKLAEIGKVLNSEGYFGPCGADIMETEDGTQYVIDLNVRTATSLILGCLKGHCEKRKFNACGVYECLLLGISRDDLEEKFEKEFEEGRIILLGDIRFGKQEKWAYPVVLAAEDQEGLKELGARILKYEAAGGDDAKEAGGA